MWKCVQDSDCAHVDNSFQMAILRDPRPMAVSSYFHQVINAPRRVQGLPVDEWVLLMLPIFCKWLSVRYFLFAELLAAKSGIFWYDETLADPTGFHHTFYSLIGLRLPTSVVAKAASVAASAGLERGTLLGFPVKGLDRHEGGEDARKDRTFRDEVNSTTLSSMDDILRVWLPPVVLGQLRVTP